MEMRQMAEALGAGRVTVFGSAHEDVVLEVARFPVPGETIVAASSERLFGGKGANQAISAAQAGAPVSFIGVVGSDEGGERVLGNLALHGIDVAGVRRSVELPTGLALISLSKTWTRAPFSSCSVSFPRLRWREPLAAQQTRAYVSS
jgi:ribokinase